MCDASLYLGWIPTKVTRSCCSSAAAHCCSTCSWLTHGPSSTERPCLALPALGCVVPITASPGRCSKRPFDALLRGIRCSSFVVAHHTRPRVPARQNSPKELDVSDHWVDESSHPDAKALRTCPNPSTPVPTCLPPQFGPSWPL